MRDALIRGQEGGVESFCSIFAGESAGFGDGEENLLFRVAVHGEVVDTFVWLRLGGVGAVGGLREHGEDCFAVGFGEGFALVMR